MRRTTSVAIIIVLLAVGAAVTGFAATLGVDSATVDTFSSDQAATTTTTTTAPTGTTVYLKTSTQGQNVASSAQLPMSTTAPTQTTLFNYDTNRDSRPGLLIQKGLSQRWVTSGPLPDDSGSFTFFSQLKDGSNNKVGSVRVRIQACNSGLSGCATMTDTTVTSTGAWHTANGVFVAKTVTFTAPGAANLNNDTRRLVIDVTVLSGSGDDMWFAYDTTAFPAALVLQ